LEGLGDVRGWGKSIEEINNYDIILFLLFRTGCQKKFLFEPLTTVEEIQSSCQGGVDHHDVFSLRKSQLARQASPFPRASVIKHLKGENLAPESLRKGGEYPPFLSGKKLFP